MTGKPFQCPECGCPIQLLYNTTTWQTRGTIEDALEAHRVVVHPQSEDLNA